MSIVRAKDLRKMSPEDVQKKLDEVQAELIRQRGKKISGGAPENPGRMKALRRAVARIITIQKESAKEGKSKEKPKVEKKKVKKTGEKKK